MNKTESKAAAKIVAKTPKFTLRKRLDEDVRTGMSVPVLAQAFDDQLFFSQCRIPQIATAHDIFRAQALTVRDRLIQRWAATQLTYHAEDVKRVFYFSAEFLMGRLLGNNLLNLGIRQEMGEAMSEFGLSLEQIEETENDAGLGNGGLGRLAACFLDSCATLELPVTGYGLRYEFGIFRQEIEDGYQVEAPDQWLKYGNPWEIGRPEFSVRVSFGGRTENYRDEAGASRTRWVDTQDVMGAAYDTPIPGFGNNTVNNLRLWSSTADKAFDFKSFDQGDYEEAVRAKTDSENISKVLYPNDNSMQGKELRLKQQYFFVSCSLQDIVRRYLLNEPNFKQFAKKTAIQLNDTHPTIAIPELMRLLLDEHQLSWAGAWEITQNTFAYTNHTLLPEALEQWPVSLFERLLPRHLELIYEINARFLDQVRRQYPGQNDRVERLSLVSQAPKNIRMAHLAVVGSFSVNGVAALHSDLLKTRVLTDFAEMFPERFNNKTNGVTPRRWVQYANPDLSELIDTTIGKAWKKDLEKLSDLEDHIAKKAFRDKFAKVKSAAKKRLAEYILAHNGLEINPESMFDIQVKRFHEYKRQHLNVLHIIHRYNEIKKNPSAHVVPRTFIFAGKAAPGYFLAKRIIKLINAVAEVVNTDLDVAGRIRVVFLENYNVSLAELLVPAADVSEQISTAGYEASGTGNMKFALNGAVTIGTLDGANVEIRECVGNENFFLFGMTADEVVTRAQDYVPYEEYEKCAPLREVIDLIAKNHFSPDEPNIFLPILDELLKSDRFMVLSDFWSYALSQRDVAEAYAKKDEWNKIALLNIARCGKFSSDRTIHQYATEIWNVKPVSVKLG